MRYNSFIRTAPVILAASAVVLLALCGCAGRTATNMTPKGVTVEVNPVAETAPADTIATVQE